MRKTVTLLTALLISVVALAAPPKVSYYILEDASLQLTADEALGQFRSGKFLLQQTRKFNPGFTRSVYWLAVEIDKTEAADSLRLVIGQTAINKIDFYSVEGNTNLVFQTGDHFPYRHRPILTVDYSFPLSARSYLYLLKIDKHNESLQLTFDTYNIPGFVTDETNTSLITGILTGIILLLLIFGLYLTVITRKRIYIFYILYITSGWLWVLADLGFGFKYLWPDSTWFAGRSRPVFSMLTISLSLEYLIYYLGGLKSKHLKFALRTVSAVSFFLALILLYPVNLLDPRLISWFLLQSIPVIAGAYILLSLFTLTWEAIRKNIMAVFYLAALIPLMLFTITYILNHAAVIDISGTFLEKYGIPVGYVSEAIILTFGLVYRFNSYRLEKERLQVDFERQKKENAEALLETEAKERKRIADELHDIAGSMLSAARLNITSIREKNLIPEAEAKLKLQKAEEAIETVADSVRSLSHALSPIMIEKIGFKNSVENITSFFNSSGKINIETIVVGFDSLDDKLSNIYSAIYSIIYELVNNIVKHSKASNAIIQLVEHDDSIILIAEDNGIGLKSEYDKQSTKGLNGIVSKINYFNGSIVLDNTEKGLIISIEIPKVLYEKNDSSG
jgi:signal transduction histidine kinase